MPLGIVLSTVTEGPPRELVELGCLAEEHGFDAVLVNEGRSDALALAQAVAQATTRVTVGTNIANVYFRHPFLCASSLRTIAELAEGRVLFGFGISHRALLARIGIDMGDARAHLERYVGYVQEVLAGRGAVGFMTPPPSRWPVPVHVAGNTVESARVAGRVGNGLMPFLTPRSHLPVLVAAARAAAAEADRGAAFHGCCLSIPTFVSTDLAAARSAACYNLAFFAQLPNYRRQWRRAGFGAAMDALRAHWAEGGDRRGAAALIPDALIDEVCLFGDAAAIRDQLAAFAAAGADLPVLAVSPVNEERLAATRTAITALAP